MLTKKVPLKYIKFYWTTIGQGIPFSFFASDSQNISGNDYTIHYNREFDSWLCNDIKMLMPISTSKLVHDVLGELPCTSFAIFADGHVQVNYRKPEGFTVRFFGIEDLYIEGQAFEVDD